MISVLHAAVVSSTPWLTKVQKSHASILPLFGCCKSSSSGAERDIELDPVSHASCSQGNTEIWEIVKTFKMKLVMLTGWSGWFLCVVHPFLSSMSSRGCVLSFSFHISHKLYVWCAEWTSMFTQLFTRLTQFENWNSFHISQHVICVKYGVGVEMFVHPWRSDVIHVPPCCHACGSPHYRSDLSSPLRTTDLLFIQLIASLVILHLSKCHW